MATSLLELLKDADLIKFFAIVGSIFFLFGVTGRVWGVKEPLSFFPKLFLFSVGALMLVSAATGFIDNKNHYFSDKINKSQQQLTEKKTTTNGINSENNQKIKGNNNKTIGNTTGNNNHLVQGNNNNLNSNNSNIVKNHYIEGDYTVYYTYNTETGDTLSRKRVKNKTVTIDDEEQDELPCSLNDKTYYMMTMRPHYFIKFYDKSGNTYKFVAYINAYDYNGTAVQTGKTIKFSGNGDGEASLSNNCKYLTGFLSRHSLNFTL